MRICVAQIQPVAGDIDKNIETHMRFIEMAILENADLIAFSELSLTGFEPTLAKNLATTPEDHRLDGFQNISDQNSLTIGIGLPINSQRGHHIGMVFFQPNQTREAYFKQQLHPDERPFFIEGNEQLILAPLQERIAPAICYESLQKDHAEHARHLGAEIYLASVAKAQRGIDQAFSYYPKLAKHFSMPVLMANCIGLCDHFHSAGQSSVWDASGRLLAQLASDTEGILIFDTATGKAIKKNKHSL